MRTYNTKIKLKFYGVKLKNSKFEKIHNNLGELEAHLDFLLREFKIDFFIDTIVEKIELLKNIIIFKEYER